MAGIINVDTLKADSNLKLQIASANVAFIDSNGLNVVGGNLVVGGTTITSTQLSQLNANGTISAAGIASVNASIATSGTLPKGRLPAGSVLQVLSVSDTSQYVYNSGSASQTTYYDITGLSLSITPTSATSKILILANVQGGQYPNGYNAFLRINRDGSAIGVGVNGSYLSTSGASWRTVDGSELSTVPLKYLDSPATTSAVTYKIQLCNSGGSTYYSTVNRCYNSYTGWEFSGASQLILMEIAA
jgi:hypothetical protein